MSLLLKLAMWNSKVIFSKMLPVCNQKKQPTQLKQNALIPMMTPATLLEKLVIVNYNDRLYVAQIMKICYNEAEINCMKQAGDKNIFIWPNNPYCMFYSCDQIV